jgi:hypothetical protein
LNTPQRTKGGWEMNGPPAVLVDRHSATHGREWESDGQFIQPVNRNHSELVKFSNRDDEYQTVTYRHSGKTRVVLLGIGLTSTAKTVSISYYYQELNDVLICLWFRINRY